MQEFWFVSLPCSEERTIPGRGYGILPSYSTHLWSGPSLWAYGPLKAALMSVMLYTQTAEPRKMELGEMQKEETRLRPGKKREATGGPYDGVMNT